MTTAVGINEHGPMTDISGALSGQSETTNALSWGMKWGGAIGTGAIVSYSFPVSNDASVWSWLYADFYDYLLVNDFAAVNATQQTGIQSALNAWSSVANISFEYIANESAGSVGDIRFANTSGDGTGIGATGFTFNNSPATGDVWIKNDPASNNGASNPALYQAGGEAYAVLLNQIGNAIGLNPTVDTVMPNSNQDNQYYTVMSDNKAANGANPSTAMLLDIKAAQDLYGANMNTGAGNDVYTFQSNANYLQTIWDASGTDQIVVNGNDNVTVNLNAGTFSQIGAGNVNDVAIAYNVTIENATTGGGNDVIHGNSASNMVNGGAGDDTFVMNATRASVTASKDANGNLVLTSGGQTDTLSNIEQVNFLDGSASVAALLQPATKGPMQVTITKNGVTTIQDAKVYEGPVDFLEFETIGSELDESFLGTDGNDFMNLMGGVDAARGGAGNDVIDGGAGSNFLSGEAGSDVFFVDGRGGDVTWSTVTDFTEGESVNIWGWQEGVSQVIASVISGAGGYEGVTHHLDLDNNGSIDASITLTGISVEDSPGLQAMSVAGNGYLLIA